MQLKPQQMLEKLGLKNVEKQKGWIREERREAYLL